MKANKRELPWLLTLLVSWKGGKQLISERKKSLLYIPGSPTANFILSTSHDSGGVRNAIMNWITFCTSSIVLALAYTYLITFFTEGMILGIRLALAAYLSYQLLGIKDEVLILARDYIEFALYIILYLIGFHPVFIMLMSVFVNIIIHFYQRSKPLVFEDETGKERDLETLGSPKLPFINKISILAFILLSLFLFNFRSENIFYNVFADSFLTTSFVFINDFMILAIFRFSKFLQADNNSIAGVSADSYVDVFGFTMFFPLAGIAAVVGVGWINAGIIGVFISSLVILIFPPIIYYTFRPLVTKILTKHLLSRIHRGLMNSTHAILFGLGLILTLSFISTLLSVFIFLFAFSVNYTQKMHPGIIAILCVALGNIFL